MKTQQLITIKESDLELIVSEKTLGSLTTNAIQIRDMVKSTLPMYDISNYNDDNIDQAKRDKAALNKAAKLLNSKRLEIEKEFMKPFGEFKEVVAETVKLIGECSAKIDTVVKQNEQQYKDKKLAVIRSYFDDGNTNLIDFRKIFKQEWLNKSTSMKAVQADIETVFAKVDEDLETLKGFGGDDFDVLRTYYMDTMNIGNTIQYANRLKEQRERKEQEEARKKVEAEQPKVSQPNPFNTANQRMNGQPSFMDQPKEQPVPAQPELLTRAFKVTTTRENIIALGNFMNEHGIDFDKIEVP